MTTEQDDRAKVRQSDGTTPSDADDGATAGAARFPDSDPDAAPGTTAAPRTSTESDSETDGEAGAEPTDGAAAGAEPTADDGTDLEADPETASDEPRHQIWDDEDDEDEARRRGPKFGGRPLTIALSVVALLYALLALWRLLGSGMFGLDGGGLGAAVLALTPHVAAAGVVLAAVIAIARRWAPALVVLVLAAALGLLVVPRIFGDAAPNAAGRLVRVLSVNMYFGSADAKAVVKMATRNRVDVLVLQEVDAKSWNALQKAGLADVLPNEVTKPAPDGAGSAIASRLKLGPLNLVKGTTYNQVSAKASGPVGAGFQIVSVHAMAPTTDSDAWVRDMQGLPGGYRKEPIRILAGDFNATLDHTQFRKLVGKGYADAADETGNALSGTWPVHDSAPSMPIDHVVVDSRVAVRDFQLLDVPGSDHRAVLARLQMPAAS